MRLTQVFCLINADELPNKSKLSQCYSHIGDNDFSAIKKVRREMEKNQKKNGVEVNENVKDNNSCSHCTDGWLMPLSYDESGVPCPHCNPKGIHREAKKVKSTQQELPV